MAFHKHKLGRFEIIGSLSKGVLEPCTSTGIEVFFILIWLNAIKFKLLMSTSGQRASLKSAFA